MQRLILSAACIAFIISACKKAEVEKKDLPILETTITATINGVDEKFNSKDTVRNIDTTGVYISGTNEANSDKMILILTNPGGLIPGTYNFPNGNGGSVELMYEPPGSTDGYFYTYYTEPSSIDPGLNYPGTITITSVSDSNLQGTFNGSLVSFGTVLHTTAPETRTITNGKFNVSINKAK